MRSSVRRFGRSRDGNFAIATAIAALPLSLAIGMGVDVATIAKTRSALQQALDAAALGIAREGSAVTQARALTIADDFVSGNFSGPYSNLAVTRTGTSFQVTADAPADTSFSRLFGYDKWPVTGLATADIAYVPYEIALVLDTTGSMNDNGGGKLRSMKDGVAKLVETMSRDIADRNNLKFALVPFAAFVNVGPQFGPAFDSNGRVKPGTAASWLDLYGNSPTPQLDLKAGVSRFEAFHNLGQEWAGCVETRRAAGRIDYDVTDAAPGRLDESLFVPAFGIDEPDSPSSGSARFTNSYITSDVDPLDGSAENAVKKLGKYGLFGDVGGTITRSTKVEWRPVATDITAARGPNVACRVKPIVPLSNDYAGLKAQVQGLVAGGNTNITEGIAWGWRVLSRGEPFTEGAADTSRVKKIVILLTDGSNTFGVRGNKLGSDYNSFGYAADERLLPLAEATKAKAGEAMNAKTLATCTNAKADGIEIYTIRLEEPNRTTGMMLKDCASDADHFFDAPSHSQLDEVFGKIRDKIVSVRISS